MGTKLAVPISAKGVGGAKRQIEFAISAGAEVIELRVDYLEKLTAESVGELVGDVKSFRRDMPVIVTCRDKRQGGEGNYAEELRVNALIEGLRAGAEFVDFEYENFMRGNNRGRLEEALNGGRLILSAHNFERKFIDINDLYQEIRRTCPGAIPKLVYTANHINDCFDGFDLLRRADGEAIVFCMGEAGLISRVLAIKLGGFVTFASLDEESSTAPGQLTIKEFKDLYRYDCIGSDTEVFGVIGEPVVHSMSTAIHNACFVEKGMNSLYLPLLVQGGKQDFEEFMDNVVSRGWLGFRGFSVTIPHKHNALEYVKARGGLVESLAKRIGAVNTIVVGDDGRLAGYNTDYAGALDAICGGLGIERDGLKNMRVAVVGAGGVSRAVVAGLADAGAEVKIYNRTVKKAERQAGEFGCEFAGLDKLVDVRAELVINCTSLGMYPETDASAVAREYIREGMTVFDTVYNPPETLLLRYAKEAGARAIDGISMFVNQAAGQFKHFTGEQADKELMRKTVCECLANK